jgi:uncharacterized damage-inducible protein DinB
MHRLEREVNREASIRYVGPVQRLGECSPLCRGSRVIRRVLPKGRGRVRSLHGTLNHLLITDRIWMRRFTGEGEHPAQLNAIMFDDLPSLEFARRAEDARIIQYVESLSEEEIGRDFNYSTTKGVPQRFILRDLLAHWFNHQTHHRGQAHCILSVLGVLEPKLLDLLAMYRNVASRHQATSD